MNIVIVGCGRVGAWLARDFHGDGHAVTVIDITSSAFRRLGDEFTGAMVVGSGLDDTVLRRAGIDRADAFVSVTNGDNRNIMAAEMAKVVFKVPRVIARVYDPARAAAFRELGLETICSTSIAGGIITDYVATGKNPAEELEGGMMPRPTGTTRP